MSSTGEAGMYLVCLPGTQVLPLHSLILIEGTCFLFWEGSLFYFSLSSVFLCFYFQSLFWSPHFFFAATMLCFVMKIYCAVLYIIAIITCSLLMHFSVFLY